MAISNLMKMEKTLKQVENTVRKVEIAPYKQFLLPFPHPSVFKTLVLQTRKNQGLFWKGLNRDTKCTQVSKGSSIL